MFELEMKNDVEAEEFSDELSDEALDRDEDGGKASVGPNYCRSRAPVPIAQR
jgi:hypothetical protein